MTYMMSALIDKFLGFEDFNDFLLEQIPNLEKENIPLFMKGFTRREGYNREESEYVEKVFADFTEAQLKQFDNDLYCKLRDLEQESIHRCCTGHMLQVDEYGHILENERYIAERTEANKMQAEMIASIQPEGTTCTAESLDEGAIRALFQNDKTRKEAIHNLAGLLTSRYTFKTVIGVKATIVYYFKDGIFVPGGDAFIQQETESILGVLSSTHHVNEVVNKIKRSTQIEQEEVGVVDDNFICLNNGIYDIKNKKLIPHSPKFMFISKVRTNYNKDATCETFKTFLKETQPSYFDTVQELMGGTLYQSNKFKKAAIYEGPADCGKTTLITAMIEMLGQRNVSTIKLQDICHSRFATSGLFGKMANLCDDLKFQAIRDFGNFKAATGDGYISGEKKHQDEFSFRNVATLIFVANDIPPSEGGNDMAYFKRWLPIRFSRVFSVDEMDMDLDKKLAKKEELEGMLLFAIEGLHRLLDNRQYTFDMTPEEVMMYMTKNSSDLAQFVEDVLEHSIGDKTSNKDMYNAYVEYFELNKDKMKEGLRTVEWLGRHLGRYAPYIYKSVTKDGRFWVNVKLKDVKFNPFDTGIKDFKD